MDRLAIAGLSGCLAAGIIACSGPSPTAPSGPAAAPSGQSTATVVTNYYRAIAAGNYRQAFTYVGPKATGPYGRKLTWPAFLQLARMLDSETGPVTRFSVGAFPSMVVMTVNRKRAGPYHAHLRMARSKNGWVIISIDRI